MPFLYESYQPRRRSFAGKASFPAPPSAYDAVTGATITRASEGQVFHISMSVYNDGTTDIIWCSAKDKDTGAVIINQKGIKLDFEQTVIAGAGFGPSFYWIKMPNKTFNILFEAGHGSGTARVKDTEATLTIPLTGAPPPAPVGIPKEYLIAGGLGVAGLILVGLALRRRR